MSLLRNTAIQALILAPCLTACVSDPKSHFAMSEMDAKQQIDFAQAKVILIGEQHDNPVHHKIQQEILEKLGQQGRLRGVVFEQVDWTDQGVLSQLNAGNLEKLPSKLEWDKSGWPSYEYYRPLFETAVKYKATVIAGGLPRNRLPLLYKQGYEGAFTAPEIERLKVRKTLDAQGLQLMEKEIFEGHCKMIPEDHVAKMVPVQRSRDAALLRGYQNEAPTDGVTVFILGAGHARKEFGLPTLFALTAPKTRVWTIGLVEEGAEALPATAFDKVWVTEKFDRPDPCVDMKKHLDKKSDEKTSAPRSDAPATAPKVEEAPKTEEAPKVEAAPKADDKAEPQDADEAPQEADEAKGE